MMSGFLQALIICSSLMFLGNTVKVCKTFIDYYIPGSKDCWNNTDAYLNVTEIIRKWRCKVEEYIITTDDGYLLTLIRAYSNVTHDTAIVLGHGIYSNSNGWVYRHDRSLAYQLIFAGYEIWLINFRGTVYSSHKTLKKNDAAFWNFSFHEMGVLDLSKCLHHIHDTTGKKSIYIGFSMGTTISYVYASVYPKDAKKMLAGIISLSAVAYISQTPSILERLAFMWNIIRDIFNYIWPGIALPITPRFNHFCAYLPSTMILCELMRTPIFGDDFLMLDPISFPIQYYIVLDAVVSKVVTHYSQIVLNQRFQWYDYGITKNLQIYGNSKPPSYNTSEISVQMALFYGENDFVSTFQNNQYLYQTLNKSFRCGLVRMEWKKWNHVDFLAARNMSFLYKLLFPKIKAIESGQCQYMYIK